MNRVTVTESNWQQKASAWVIDYSAARDRAIKWLGDRYLLAMPVTRIASSRRTSRAK